ncbi:MAG: alpha/beta fold hydrolase [Burkholderiales bacterium]|nr:alpha/beta fold hydrolase [Burkholderiales bacterium]
MYNDLALSQLAAVFSHVQARVGDQRPLVVVGLCSGGYAAFRQAVVDARVSALLLANVQRFIWQDGMSLEAAMRVNSKSTQAYRKLLFRPETWTRVMQGKVNVGLVVGKFVQSGRAWWVRTAQSTWRRLVSVAARATGVSCAGNLTLVAQRPDTIAGCFVAMARRGVRVTVLYSEDDGGRDEFAAYFGADGKRFLAQPGTRLQLVPGADHVLSAPESRGYLLAEIRLLCKNIE